MFSAARRSTIVVRRAGAPRIRECLDRFLVDLKAKRDRMRTKKERRKARKTSVDAGLLGCRLPLAITPDFSIPHPTITVPRYNRVHC